MPESLDTYVLVIGSTRLIGPREMTAAEAAERNAHKEKMKCVSRWVKASEHVEAPKPERKFTYQIRRGGT